MSSLTLSTQQPSVADSLADLLAPEGEYSTTQTYLWSGLERHRVRQMKQNHPRAKRKK